MSRFRVFLLLICAVAFGRVALPPGGYAQDDRDLFGSAVTPNVLLLLDNSRSMREIITHPNYDPDFRDPSCAAPTGVFYVRTTFTSRVLSSCPGAPGVRLYRDLRINDSTVYRRQYAYWLEMGATPDLRREVINMANGTYDTQCEIDWFGGQTTFSLYVRTRMSAARDVLAEVLCEQRNLGNLRIAFATFRRITGVLATEVPPSTAQSQVETTLGGHIVVPMGDITSTQTYLRHPRATVMRNQFEQLREVISNVITPSSRTPLSEALFASYQYFMSRNAAQTAVGNSVGTRFPPYAFTTSRSTSTDGGSDGVMVPGGVVTPDPVLRGCQPNFVLILTDGFPAHDTFEVPDHASHRPIAPNLLTPPDFRAQTVGWDSITSLIPDAVDYAGELARCQNSVGVGETRTHRCYLRSGSGPTGQYDILLDDIAAVMASRDLRPDLTGQQVVHTYTIAFSASAEAVQLLEHTARVGGGQSYAGRMPEEVRDGLRDAFRAFRAQQHSFTAPLVPAVSRSAGASFYRAYFRPNFDVAFWEGHLEHRDFSTGRDDGTLYWDAGSVLQNTAPSARDLRVSLPTLSAGDPLPRLDTTEVARSEVFARADQLQGFGTPATPVVADFDATDADDVHEVALATLRGCVYPTSGTGCVSRATPVAAGTTRADGTALLGDIFHSRPVVVGAPRGVSNEVSYAAFRQGQRTRARRVYVGANDGFLHAFDGGSWNTAQRRYGAGTGAEQFGFMPWPVRHAIPEFVRSLSTGNPSHRFFVDGSPAASDVWFYNDDLSIQNKQANGSEWRTVLIGGLRRGGNAYYALDVTGAGVGANNVRYLWEYPEEGTASPGIGQTWARPIIAKVKARHGGAAQERWVAIVTGGYAEPGDPNRTAYDATDDAGRGIYLIDIKTGKVLGQKRLRRVTEPGIAATDPRVNLLYAIPSTPAVFDVDDDDYADVIYVGDLGGNVWKWVIADSGGNYLEDAVNDTMADVSQPHTNFQLFFSAKATRGDVLGVVHNSESYFRSFFFPPAGVLRGGTLWLALGSGERAHLARPAGPEDATATSDNHRFYVLTDPDPVDTALPTPVPPAQNGGMVDAGTASTAATEQDLVDVTSLSTCTSLGSGQRGYYFMAANGERFTTDVLVSRSQVIVGSFEPGGGTVGACGQSTGQGYLYHFKLACGEGLTGQTGMESRSGRRAAAGAGAPNSPRRTVNLPSGSSNIYHNTSHEVGLTAQPGPAGYSDRAGQLYWRERRR